MKSILESIMVNYNKTKVSNKLAEGLYPEQKLIFWRKANADGSGVFQLCTDLKTFHAAIDNGGIDVTNSAGAWDHYAQQEANNDTLDRYYDQESKDRDADLWDDEQNNGQYGTFEESYDILDTKTNKKVNAKSYKNKKKAVGRVESANIAHGTPRYKLKINEAYTNLDPATAVSPEQLKRLSDKWSMIAGEPVTIQAPQGSNGPVYAYGSEAACKQLLNKLKVGNVNTAKDGTWYYTNK